MLPNQTHTNGTRINFRDMTIIKGVPLLSVFVLTVRSVYSDIQLMWVW